MEHYYCMEAQRGTLLLHRDSKGDITTLWGHKGKHWCVGSTKNCIISVCGHKWSIFTV